MIPDSVFTLDAAKAHLRITHAVEDVLITAMLDAAVAACERITRRAWTVRNWSSIVDAADLDWCARNDPEVFHAALSPATAKVYVFDATGTDVQVPAADVIVSTQFGHTVLNVNTWPTTASEGNIGRIDWSAKPPGDVVPPDVYSAVMLYLGDLYENRESQIVGVVSAVNDMSALLLRSYIIDLHA